MLNDPKLHFFESDIEKRILQETFPNPPFLFHIPMTKNFQNIRLYNSI